MTPKQQILHKKLIKQLHLSKRYRDYYKQNREEYEEFLDLHFGVKSSKALDVSQLIELVDYMNFKKESLKIFSPTLCSAAQQNLIKEYWRAVARDNSEAALLTFVQRVLKKRYLHLYMLTKIEAQIVIPVLKNMNNV